MDFATWGWEGISCRPTLQFRFQHFDYYRLFFFFSSRNIVVVKSLLAVGVKLKIDLVSV